MQHTVAYCNARQHTATHCNTLQHTATHCNTLQHITTHCNTEERHQLNLYLCICVHVYTYIYIYTVRRHSGVHCAGSYFVQPYKRQANPISGGKHPQTYNVCAVQTQRPQRQRNTKVYVEQILKTFIIQQSMAHRDLKFSKIRVNRAFSSFFLTVTSIIQSNSVASRSCCIKNTSKPLFFHGSRNICKLLDAPIQNLTWESEWASNEISVCWDFCVLPIFTISVVNRYSCLTLGTEPSTLRH